MSLHLMSLVSDSGVPIFSKKRGNTESLPFSTVASLSTVAMFCKNQGAQLISTEFDDGLIMWKEFENNIMVIGIARDITDTVLADLIELTFNAMVLVVGVEELRNVQNIDRLKRDLKQSLAVIDSLMEAVDTDLLMYNDSVLAPENMELSIKLREYAEVTKSPYVCLLVKQKIACGTEGWWLDLHVIDRKLLIFLNSVLTTVPREMPVFLPIKAPTIAYRFIAIALTQHLTICMLCGPEPPYAELESITQQFWSPEINLLAAAEKIYPRNFPEDVSLDDKILGLMLVNEKTRRYMISKNHQAKNAASGHRLDILRTFFHQAIVPVRQALAIDINAISTENQDSEETFRNSEQFWCSDYHKSHAVLDGDNVLCVLYTASIATDVMQGTSKKLLEQLLQDKNNTQWQLF
ncbi:protein fuzzy [Culicoides brevitarsis]|uniref:protein fuzzy n=1 Tax=Culicoides brevitarsis TaxID=469753 RepID=UPI00307C86AC